MAIPPPPEGFRAIAQQFDNGRCQLCPVPVMTGELVWIKDGKIVHPDCAIELDREGKIWLPSWFVELPIDWPQVQWLAGKAGMMLSTRPSMDFPAALVGQRGNRLFWRLGDVIKYLGV